MYTSEEYAAAQEFLDLERAFLDMIGDDPDLPALMYLVDAVGTATHQFGLCELFDRKAGRLADEGSGGARADGYRALSERYHKRGLAALDRALRESAALNKQIEESRTRHDPDRANPAIRDLVEEMGLLFGESALKVSDVEKLRRTLREAVEGSGGGPAGTGKYVAAKLNDLREARLSEDRGNRDNIPVWKIVIIAVYVGVSILKIIRCTIRDRCRRGEKAAYEAAAVALGISLKFC